MILFMNVNLRSNEPRRVIWSWSDNDSAKSQQNNFSVFILHVYAEVSTMTEYNNAGDNDVTILISIHHHHHHQQPHCDIGGESDFF